MFLTQRTQETGNQWLIARVVLLAVIPIFENTRPSWLEDLVPEGYTFLPDDIESAVLDYKLVLPIGHSVLFMFKELHKRRGCFGTGMLP